MAIVERPNLRDQMIAAQNREQAAKVAQMAAQKEGRILSESEKRRINDTTWERHGAEKIYYSQSGRGIPPWEQTLQRWALAIGIIGVVAIALWNTM